MLSSKENYSLGHKIVITPISRRRGFRKEWTKLLLTPVIATRQKWKISCLLYVMGRLMKLFIAILVVVLFSVVAFAQPVSQKEPIISGVKISNIKGNSPPWIYSSEF